MASETGTLSEKGGLEQNEKHVAAHRQKATRDDPRSR